jgi:anthranilate synthase component 1
MDTSKIEFVKTLINIKSYPHYKFSISGKESFNIGEMDFKEMVSKSKEHCKRGDVFQIVLSRTFNKSFKGDEFNVYRALRAINPSPYLFYFDFGSFRIFGSSPEAQLKVTNGKAIINPIAGTFKRTGNDQEDYSSAEELLKDPKENAEHTMLVDLARNDLSRHCTNVKVASYKEIQFYSHVIHLVSEVEGELNDPGNPVLIFADTFPAGTLSGAPKYKAMELIDTYEKSCRGFYGGAIGYFGFNNEVNHAITIRSFLSMNNTLTYQAGAGIVADSQEENELQEVNNKLEALKKAIIMAEKV